MDWICFIAKGIVLGSKCGGVKMVSSVRCPDARLEVKKDLSNSHGIKR